MDKAKLSTYIDHTLLKPDTNEKQIIDLCNEAMKYHFASVCINPVWVKKAGEVLINSDIKVCTVIGFPLGANTINIKSFEANKAILDGAEELDMVINIGKLKSGNWDFVQNDIEMIVQEAKGKSIVKVILETCLLTDEEKVKACQIAQNAGADFVKTSTGFSTGGATIEDVKLMRKTVGDTMGVKASGGIRDYEIAVKFIEAGATRIGASSGVKIVS
jgi:deoxyribose-phosphate aldolase